MHEWKSRCIISEKYRRNEEPRMSFTGIFKAKDGLAAIADSKGSIKENGKYIEDPTRNPQKLFPFSNGVAVTCGANQISVQNPNRLFPQTINLEDLVFEYLQSKHTLDSGFFQTLLVKMGTDPSNQEPVHFLIGRKIRASEYILERHQIGYRYYAERIGLDTDLFFTAGDELYQQTFSRMDSIAHITSVDVLQKFVASKLDSMIKFYDETLSYNPVGGIIRSYILK